MHANVQREHLSIVGAREAAFGSYTFQPRTISRSGPYQYEQYWSTLTEKYCWQGELYWISNKYKMPSSWKDLDGKVIKSIITFQKTNTHQKNAIRSLSGISVWAWGRQYLNSRTLGEQLKCLDSMFSRWCSNRRLIKDEMFALNFRIWQQSAIKRKPQWSQTSRLRSCWWGQIHPE